jgi:hypothetical protein
VFVLGNVSPFASGQLEMSQLEMMDQRAAQAPALLERPRE